MPSKSVEDAINLKMQLTIQNKKENVLLKRKEVQGILNFKDTTPSNKEVTEVLAKELNSDSSLIVIKNIYTRFSKKEADFTAVIYLSAEAKAKTEKMTKHQKKLLEEQKKREEEKKAAMKSKKEEEAKAAEKKEESE